MDLEEEEFEDIDNWKQSELDSRRKYPISIKNTLTSAKFLVSCHLTFSKIQSLLDLIFKVNLFMI